MTIIQSIVLGLVQGLTEFLPVSSSGHLILFTKIFGWQDQGLFFDVVLHLGSLLAVLFYFRNTLIKMVKAVFSKKEELAQDRKLFWFLILSTIPAVILGIFLKDRIENTFRSVYIVVFGLIFWGLVLWGADLYLKNYKNPKDIKKFNWKNALFVGFAQSIALFPGTSRSGITMSAGLFSGFDRESAIRFSFLMSIPVISGAGLFTLLDVIETGASFPNYLFLALGFLSAFVSGLLAIWFLMKLIKKRSFTPFVIYRILLGLIILLFFV
jgi:undecaprenyl-diphosphatase